MLRAGTSASTRPTTRWCSSPPRASGGSRRRLRSASLRLSSTRSQDVWRRRMDEAVGSERVDAEAAGAVHRIVENLAVVVHAPDETLRLVVLCHDAERHLTLENSRDETEDD